MRQSHSILKRRNTSQILRLILEKHAISRRDIALQTGLTPATVSNLSGELLAAGLVAECERPPVLPGRKGGPHPVPLSIAAEKPCVLAVYLGVNELAVGLVSLRGTDLRSTSLHLDAKVDADALLDIISVHADELCREQGVDIRRDVLGIGFGSMGAVDSARGVLQWHARRPFRELALRDLLARRLGLPVFVENIIQALAMAESWFGKGRDLGNYLYVFAADTVNGAIVVDGTVLRGVRMMSSMLGDIIVDPAGLPCPCGRKGCLHVMGSDWGIVAQAKGLVAHSAGLLATLAKDRAITVDLVREAARLGDGDCHALLARRVVYLGQSIARVVNLTDFQAVILSMDLPEPAADDERRVLFESYLGSADTGTGRPPQLLISPLRESYLLTGAAALVISAVCSPGLELSATPSGGLRARLGSSV